MYLENIYNCPALAAGSHSTTSRASSLASTLVNVCIDITVSLPLLAASLPTNSLEQNVLLLPGSSRARVWTQWLCPGTLTLTPDNRESNNLWCTCIPVTIVVCYLRLLLRGISGFFDLNSSANASCRNLECFLVHPPVLQSLCFRHHCELWLLKSTQLKHNRLLFITSSVGKRLARGVYYYPDPPMGIFYSTGRAYFCLFRGLLNWSTIETYCII